MALRVCSVPTPDPLEVFDLTVTQINDTTVRVTVITNYGHSAYVAKGIPEELLPRA